MTTENETEIGPKSRVTLATLFLVLAGVLGGGAWCWRVESLLNEIKTGNGDRWPKRSMRVWSYEAERLNAGWKAPDVDEISRRMAEHEDQSRHPRVALGNE